MSRKAGDCRRRDVVRQFIDSRESGERWETCEHLMEAFNLWCRLKYDSLPRSWRKKLMARISADRRFKVTWRSIEYQG